MKNTSATLTALALCTSLSFSAQSALVNLTVVGSTEATIFAPDEETQRTVSGGNAAVGEQAQEVSEFSIFSELPTFITGDDAFYFDSAFSTARAAQTGTFNINTAARGNAVSRSELRQIYQVENGSVAGDFLFNFKIEAGFLSARCGAGFILDNNDQPEVNEAAGEFAIPQAFNVQTADTGCSDNYAFSTYETSISINRSNSSEELFYSQVSVSSDDSGNSIQTSGAVIGQEQPFGPFNEAAYTINESLNSIDILDILANESFTVVYKVSMFSASVGNSSLPQIDSDLPQPQGPWALAAFGDPSGFQGPNAASTSLVAPVAQVSAPGNLLILSLGFAALAFARKRGTK